MSDSSILRADLCLDAGNLSEECFKLNPLQPVAGGGADDNSGGHVGGGDGDDDGGDGGDRQGLHEEGWQPVNNTDINFQLPLDLSCEHCVLRLVVKEEKKKRSEWRICSDISIIGREANQESREGVVMNEALPKGLTTITRQIENIEKVLYENVKPINLATKLPKKKITTTATTTTTPTTKSTIQKRTETELATATKPKELKPTSQTKTPISTTTLHSTTSTRAPSFSSTSSKLSTRPPSNLVSSPPPQIIKSQLPIVDHPQSSTSAPHQTSDNIQASTLFSTTSRPPTSTISTPMAKTTSGTMRSVSESIFGDGSSLSLLADVQTSMAPSESNWTQDLMEASRKKSTEILGRKNDSRMDTIDKVLTKENLENDAKEEENLDDALLEDEVIKELLDKSINATVSIEDPLTGENKTVIIQVLKLKSIHNITLTW